MNAMGFFDFDNRLKELTASGDPLVTLKKAVPWEMFRSDLETLREKPRKSNAGRKPYDVVLMFKILILGSLYNLSDDALEYQIQDRLSFMRFLDLSVGSHVPDAKTIWLFREQLTQASLAKALFERFEEYLCENGFAAHKGQIVDASIVKVPTQRNSREENARIKQGNPPQDWSENKRRQKDTDARWTRKNNCNYFGYKNHVSVDVEHKLVREYEVTVASVHDSKVFETLLDSDNSSRDVWADSAYRSPENLSLLSRENYREHIQRKGTRSKPLSEREKQANRTRSKIRSRIEHVFGVQSQIAGRLIVRSIGKVRAATVIGLRNLAYNLNRYGRVYAEA